MSNHTQSALPDAQFHDTDPAYARALIERAGLSQRKAAAAIGINDRTMRDYVSGDSRMPYSVQFCLEVLARSGAVRDEPPTEIHWFKPAARPFTDADIGLVICCHGISGAYLIGQVVKDGFGFVIEDLTSTGVDRTTMPANVVSEYAIVGRALG